MCALTDKYIREHAKQDLRSQLANPSRSLSKVLRSPILFRCLRSSGDSEIAQNTCTRRRVPDRARIHRIPGAEAQAGIHLQARHSQRQSTPTRPWAGHTRRAGG
jgi:hypothetical protein